VVGIGAIAHIEDLFGREPQELARPQEPPRVRLEGVDLRVGRGERDGEALGDPERLELRCDRIVREDARRDSPRIEKREERKQARTARGPEVRSRAARSMPARSAASAN
jgi:hypothetical protein